MAKLWLAGVCHFSTHVALRWHGHSVRAGVLGYAKRAKIQSGLIRRLELHLVNNNSFKYNNSWSASAVSDASPLSGRAGCFLSANQNCVNAPKSPEH